MMQLKAALSYLCVILSEAKDLKTPLDADSHAHEILRFTQDDKMDVVSMMRHDL